MAGYRPLNVKDALSYLDQVKVQFSDQPEVYNRFLDIMKDFKSQTIDTPGVIERVSSLFQGHPSLIQGFNTFLPPGYHIECSTNPHEPNSSTIRVTTPSGTLSTSTGGATGDGHQPATTTTGGSTGSTASGYYPAPPSYSQVTPPPTMMQTLQPHPPTSQITQQAVTHFMSGSQSNIGIGITANTHNQQQQQQGKRAPVEFNHAINYVNKIKNRFSTEPETYKQFLEILQTYQKEQKPIQEVYSQVQDLFKSAPDLLDEFKQFLPDTSGNFPVGSLLAQAHGTGIKTHHLIPAISSVGARLPPVGNFPPSQSAPNKNDGYKKPLIDSSTGVGSGSTAGMSSSPSGQSKKKRPVSGIGRNGISGSPGKTKKTKHQHKPSQDPSLEDESKQPLRRQVSDEEILFFEKVKQYLGDKSEFTDFLKIIHLYTCRILDDDHVVDSMRVCLGKNNELFQRFKQFIKYDKGDEIVINTPVDRPNLNLKECKAYGPSYRQLPDAYRESHMPCSGKDQLCHEVLNDEWVSYPTWASEDGGFQSHKKNQYEEAMFKTEDERYEYDQFIQTNLYTIAMLEPIALKIAKMTPEEKAKYRLGPGLGGKSLTYQRVIKKIYGDLSDEVLEAIHSNSAMAIPVVLKRLKQKDEEFRRAQRQWNKIWREVDANNYHKSLDHRGITFKADDKKTWNNKNMISEIEALQREQMEDEEFSHQLKYTFNDLEVFKDVAHVLFTSLDHAPTVAPVDRAKIKPFLKSFIIKYFDLSSTFFDGFLEDTDMLLDKEEGANVGSSEESQQIAAPLEYNWIQIAQKSREDLKAVVSKAGIGKPRNTFTCFFGNSQFYCLFRYIQVLFMRFEQMKIAPPPRSASPNHTAPVPVAVQLGLREPDVDPDSVGEPYIVLSELIDKFIEEEYDSTEFEDRLRQIYGIKAYVMFTVDKIAMQTVKQMQSIVNDHKAGVLLRLFEENLQHQSEPSKVRARIMYQLQANTIIGSEDHTYRIDYHKGEKTMTISLSGRDGSFGNAVSSEETWAFYVYSYMNVHPTQGLPWKSKTPFLVRNILSKDDNMPSLDLTQHQTKSHKYIYRNDLEIKIRINSYHVFFVNNTEDSFIRLNPPVSQTKLDQDKMRRKSKWDAWLLTALANQN
ncbi:hypothetical protein G9A89_022953 [Geosiphon pyriformis]|nr:hypothetical protein G9A89_022953 [Geosiphon pyriformis]